MQHFLSRLVPLQPLKLLTILSKVIDPIVTWSGENDKLCTFKLNSYQITLANNVTTVLICFFLCTYQKTPLHTAAGAGYIHTVKHLVKKGADINIKDNRGVSIWDYPRSGNFHVKNNLRKTFHVDKFSVRSSNFIKCFIRMLNFCGWSQPWNYFNSENFPIYGILLFYMYIVSVIHGCECDLGITEDVHYNRQQYVIKALSNLCQLWVHHFQMATNVTQCN